MLGIGGKCGVCGWLREWVVGPGGRGLEWLDRWCNSHILSPRIRRNSRANGVEGERTARNDQRGTSRDIQPFCTAQRCRGAGEGLPRAPSNAYPPQPGNLPSQGAPRKPRPSLGLAPPATRRSAPSTAGTPTSRTLLGRTKWSGRRRDCGSHERQQTTRAARPLPEVPFWHRLTKTTTRAVGSDRARSAGGPPASSALQQGPARLPVLLRC